MGNRSTHEYNFLSFQRVHFTTTLLQVLLLAVCC